MTVVSVVTDVTGLAADPALQVLATGASACLQDLGRTGYRDLGVGRSGAADRSAHRLANRLVGNAESAATVEITYGGLAIRLLRAATIAFTGAGCPGPRAWNTALSLPAGSVVSLGAPSGGLRSYLALRGGIAIEPVLRSRATDSLSGLGPAPLRAGDRLAGGDEATTIPGEAVGVPNRVGATGVWRGPRADWFAPDAMSRLVAGPWLVRPDSNRIGLRLDGPQLRRTRAGELASEPTLPGAIQVPPDGYPIVLGPDAPVTGGYPVIAVVDDTGLDRLGQLAPGDRVTFRELG